jgi:hypothetical protein
LTDRHRSGLDRYHGDGAGPIIADIEAVAIGAHSKRFGIAADVDGMVTDWAMASMTDTLRPPKLLT